MKAELTLSAQSLGQSFINDPELNIPTYPRFIDEIKVIPYGGSKLIFEGSRDTQVISGRSARQFLPQLLPMLDGRHSIYELGKQFPQVGQRAIIDAITLLYSRGLIESGEKPVVSETLRDFCSHAGRYIDVTRANESRSQILERLAESRVALLKIDDSDSLGACFSGLGLKSINTIELNYHFKQQEFDLIVVVINDDKIKIDNFMRRAHQANITTLHLHIGQDKVEVGPLLIPGISGCYQCMRKLIAPPQGEASFEAPFWNGVISQYAINFLARLGPVKLYNNCHVHRRTECGPVYHKQQLARLPGCIDCGLEGAGPQLEHPDFQIWLLHNAPHVMTCKQLRSPKDHQLHYAAKNLKITLQKPLPRYGCPSISLPEVKAGEKMPAWHSQPKMHSPLTLSTLSELLYYTYGYQNSMEGKRRIAASGGGMGSAECYLIVRQLDGLAPGVYHYFATEHLLHRLGHVDDTLVSGALGEIVDNLAPVILVSCANLTKLRDKYDEFCFRLGALDAGVARQYLQEICSINGISMQDYCHARDAVLSHCINLATAGNRNMVCFALGVGKLVDQESQGTTAEFLYHQGADRLIALSANPSPQKLHQWHELEPLKIAPHPARTLSNLMLERRSTRVYSTQPIASDVIRSLAMIAREAEHNLVLSGGLSLRTKLWLVRCKSDDNLVAGAYLWDDQQQQFNLVKAGFDRVSMQSTTQQHGFAEAAVSWFVTGDMEHTISHFGARGYRELLSRSSAMLIRIQLAALNWNIVGSLWGGIAEEGVGQLLDIDRYRDCPLFAASLGYKAE